MGQTAEAEASLRRALEVQPGYVWAPYYLGIALLLRGDLDAALAAVRRDAPLAQAAGLPIVYWALGRKAEAEAALRKLIAERANDAAYEIAEVYAYRSDRDEAFKWLERAYAQKDGGLHLIKGDPLLTNLEPDPRFKAFLKKMNLPE
jgi:tetratricopeptide (TPR) repeat protein